MNARSWQVGGGVVLALAMLLVGPDTQGAAKPKLVADMNKLVDAIAKDPKDVDGHKKAAAALAKAHDFEVVMKLFELRTKDGIGIGAKPGEIKPDGIEQLIIALDRNAPAAADVKDQAAAWAQLGYICAAVSDLMTDPAKADITKANEQKVWKTHNEAFKKASLAFAEAAKKNPTPASIQKAARALNDTCLKCHDDFR